MCPEKADPITRLPKAPDPVTEAFKAGIDRTLLRANLARTPTERVENLMALQRLADEARVAGQRMIEEPPQNQD